MLAPAQAPSDSFCSHGLFNKYDSVCCSGPASPSWELTLALALQGLSCMTQGTCWGGWVGPWLSYLPSPLLIPPSVLLSSKTPTLPTFQNAHPLIQMVPFYHPIFLNVLYTYPDKVPKLFFSLTYSSSELVVSSIGSISMIPWRPSQGQHGFLWARKTKDRKSLATSLPHVSAC